MKFASADPVTVPATVEFVGLVVKRRVFVPVSNLGFASMFGSGISNVAFKNPNVSYTSLAFVTVASAPLVCPLSFIPFWTCPKN